MAGRPGKKTATTRLLLRRRKGQEGGLKTMMENPRKDFQGEGQKSLAPTLKDENVNVNGRKVSLISGRA